MALYFIRRGPRPEHHRAPYVPHLICDRKDIAEWEAGWTGDRAWMWVRENQPGAYGWLLIRWEGLAVEYGHIVRTCTLPDGAHTAFWHPHDRAGEPQVPWTLMPGAVWWSPRRMPDWLAERGVVYPRDRFTQQRILDQRSEMDWERECRRRPKASADGTLEVTLSMHVSGAGREIPAWWPAPVEREEAACG